MYNISQCEDDSGSLLEQEIAEIHKKLNDEMKSAPASSTAKLSIEKEPQGLWVVDLAVVFPRGRISILRRGEKLSELIEQITLEARNNIHVWRAHQEIENFHFNKMTEADLFAEVSALKCEKNNSPFWVMVVEDDPAASKVLATTLHSLGCEVEMFLGPDGAIQRILQKQPDLLILDWNLPYQKDDHFLIDIDHQLQKRDEGHLPKKLIPVVICSTLPLQQITLPPVSHFYFFNYWNKGLPFSSVLSNLDKTVEQLSEMNGL